MNRVTCSDSGVHVVVKTDDLKFGKVVEGICSDFDGQRKTQPINHFVKGRNTYIGLPSTDPMSSSGACLSAGVRVPPFDDTEGYPLAGKSKGSIGFSAESPKREALISWLRIMIGVLTGFH